MEVFNRLVIPANDGFIGRQFLVIPITTDILSKSFVDPADIRIPRRALLTGNRETGITLGKYLFIGCRICVNICRSKNIRINRPLIQVLDTGGKEQR
jgi:formate hydrogenlyase subunit 6/NADH:ubiquinone oxidoreductase subunit I